MDNIVINKEERLDGVMIVAKALTTDGVVIECSHLWDKSEGKSLGESVGVCANKAKHYLLYQEALDGQ